MKKKINLLELVSIYYKNYKDYEEAYSKLGETRKELLAKLKPIIENENSKDEEFKYLSKEFLIIRSMYPQEVSFAATKFLAAADVYIKTSEEELPKEYVEDYNMLKSREYKSAFSIQNGRFERNTKVKLPEIPQGEYDSIFKMMENEFKDK